MPYSKNQKIAAAIALHNPSRLKPENRGMLSMSKSELHDFASGPIKKSKVRKALESTKDDIEK